MPSASKEVVDWVQEKFGSISDYGPIKFLEEEGFTSTRDWEWIPPAHVKTALDLTNDQEMAIIFLIEEWDFGGLKLDKPTNS